MAAREAAAVDAEGPSVLDTGPTESVADGVLADANLPLRKSEMEAAADLGASGISLELIAVKA